MSSRDGLPYNGVPDAPSEEALAQLAGGDAMGAFQTLRPALATVAEGDVGVLRPRLFEEAAPDLRADDVLVREILAMPPGPDASASTMAEVLRVRDAVRPLPETRTAGMFRGAGARRLQRGGSAVPSARFGR